MKWVFHEPDFSNSIQQPLRRTLVLKVLTSAKREP